MGHRASPIVGWGALRMTLPPIVELRVILGLLVLWCWCIASLHGLIAVLRLSPKLLLSIGLLPIGLLSIPCLGLSIALLVLLWSAAAAPATAARHKVLYLCCHLIHESSV